MKPLKFLKFFGRELARYAKWLWKHRDELAEIAEVVFRLAKNAEPRETGKAGEEKGDD